MIKHVVFFGMAAHEADQRSGDLATLRATLEGLRGQIPQLSRLEVGLDFTDADGHWDAVLITEFNSRSDLASYQSHPRHVAGLSILNPLVARRAVVDYEV